jgi:hypothetical protein
MNRKAMFPILVAAMVSAVLAIPAPAAAHCDSMNGPVVKAARAALATGKVELVLVWVQAVDEQEIREAFARTQRVRRAGGEARELADLWFFETLVRIHRRGEGAPYTGLKGPDYEVPAGIAAADRTVNAGALEGLDEHLAHQTLEILQAKFAVLSLLRGYDPNDVETGRRFVHAYVDFIHFVENLHALLEGYETEHEHR